MVLSERERQIAILGGAGVGLLLLIFTVIRPYVQDRADISSKIEDADAKLKDARSLANRQQRMRKIWAAMKAGGLGDDESEARSQLQDDLARWTADSGVNLTQLTPTVSFSQSAKNTPEAKFHQVGFHMTGTGPLSTLSQLLWRMETAAVPIRVVDLQISPRNGKEGQDDLQFQLSVSSLYQVSDTDKNRPFGGTADARGGGL